METLSLSDLKIYSEDWSWQQTNRYRQHKTTYPDHSTQGQKCSIITMCLQKPMIAKIVHLSQPSRLNVGYIYKPIRLVVREKIEAIWISPTTKAPIPTEMSKGQRDNTNTSPKSSITQRLWTDLGRSVGVITVTQLYQFYRAHLPTHRNSCVLIEGKNTQI